jgi:lipopolysaccharide/colanic/teichoic acid biosynthesis glycosyltransferase
MTIYYRDHVKDSLSAQKVYRPTGHVYAPIRGTLYHRRGKRFLDLTLIFFAAPLVVLLVGIFALLVARDGGQPFYTQTRVGRNGRFYKMWKLRSMVRNADQKLEAHLAGNSEARTEWNRTQKLKNDPRITPFGRFLRRSSMDELPQLWNVVRGEMSLVGPRPMMPSQTDLYPGVEYYNLRPGITGCWQISARNTCDFIDRATFDASYSKTLTLKEDCRILAATFRVVLRATGH